MKHIPINHLQIGDLIGPLSTIVEKREQVQLLHTAGYTTIRGNPITDVGLDINWNGISIRPDKRVYFISQDFQNCMPAKVIPYQPKITKIKELPNGKDN